MTTSQFPPVTTPNTKPASLTPGKRLLTLILLYAGQFFTAMVMVSVVVGGMVLFVPKYREIFNDFRTPLPPLTEWCLNLSDFISTGGWLLAPVLMVIIPIPLTLLGACLKGRKAWLWLLLVGILMQFLFLLIYLLVLFVAIRLPFIKLVQSISGGAEGGG